MESFDFGWILLTYSLAILHGFEYLSNILTLWNCVYLATNIKHIRSWIETRNITCNDFILSSYFLPIFLIKSLIFSYYFGIYFISYYNYTIGLCINYLEILFVLFFDMIYMKFFNDGWKLYNCKPLIYERYWS